MTGHWWSAWNGTDQDKDGNPGVSIGVDLPLCSGTVYVSMRSRSDAQAAYFGAAIEGEITVHLQQKILGASNFCLRLGPKIQRDTLQGVFRYRQLPTEQACDEMTADGWPSIERS